MTPNDLNWIARIGIAMASQVNPVTGGPAAPLKASALLDAYGPSLMPRKSLHQGLAGGLAILGAEILGRAVDAVVCRAAPERSPLSWRLGARAGLAALGA
ncbi:MAG TPA: hypothetical protein VF115_12605, partial [Acidimicrobiia bacterium]